MKNKSHIYTLKSETIEELIKIFGEFDDFKNLTIQLKPEQDVNPQKVVESLLKYVKQWEENIQIVENNIILTGRVAQATLHTYNRDEHLQKLLGQKEFARLFTEINTATKYYQKPENLDTKNLYLREFYEKSKIRYPYSIKTIDAAYKTAYFELNDSYPTIESKKSIRISSTSHVLKILSDADSDKEEQSTVQSSSTLGKRTRHEKRSADRLTRNDLIVIYDSDDDELRENIDSIKALEEELKTKKKKTLAIKQEGLNRLKEQIKSLEERIQSERAKQSQYKKDIKASPLSQRDFLASSKSLEDQISREQSKQAQYKQCMEGIESEEAHTASPIRSNI